MYALVAIVEVRPCALARPHPLPLSLDRLPRPCAWRAGLSALLGIGALEHGCRVHAGAAWPATLDAVQATTLFGPHCVLPMLILNLYFMQGSIKECMFSLEQDRNDLCTLPPTQILTMLLSMLTSAAMFRCAFARCALTAHLGI